MTAGPETPAKSPPPAPHMFRTPLGPRMLSLFGVVVLGFITVLLAGLAALAFAMHWALGLLVMAVAVFLGALTGYVGRDLAGKWGLSMRLDSGAVTLNLPSGRSLIHRPPKQHLTVAYDDIASVETRLEAYGSLGIEMMQRAYVLRRKNNALIFLFEDRALGAGMAEPMFSDIAAELCARAGVPLRDLGMVEGKAGFLGLWGSEAPDWAAPSLPMARQIRLWRHVAFSSTLTFAIIFVAFAIRALVGR